MNPIFSLKAKYKIALLLLLIVSVILSGMLIERYFFSSINDSSTSIFEDRLVPANEMFHMADHMMQRRLWLEAASHNPSNAQMLRSKSRTAAHRHRIDSLLVAFEHTYLVQAETQSLPKLKRNLSAFTQAETNILNSENPSVQQIEEMRIAYENVRLELISLSSIQISVGKELLNETHENMKNADAARDVQIVIILIICILAQVIILTAKSLSSPINQKHNLN